MDFYGKLSVSTQTYCVFLKEKYLRAYFRPMKVNACGMSLVGRKNQSGAWD